MYTNFITVAFFISPFKVMNKFEEFEESQHIKDMAGLNDRIKVLFFLFSQPNSLTVNKFVYLNLHTGPRRTRD